MEYPYLTDKDFKIESVTDQGDPYSEWDNPFPDSYVYLVYYIELEKVEMVNRYEDWSLENLDWEWTCAHRHLQDAEDDPILNKNIREMYAEYIRRNINTPLLMGWIFQNLRKFYRSQLGDKDHGN